MIHFPLLLLILSFLPFSMEDTLEVAIYGSVGEYIREYLPEDSLVKNSFMEDLLMVGSTNQDSTDEDSTDDSSVDEDLIENHLKSFWSDDCVGPLRSYFERYLVTKFIISPRKIQLSSNCKWLQVHVVKHCKVVITLLPLDPFLCSVESAIDASKRMIEEEKRELRHLYKKLEKVCDVLGRFIHNEAIKVSNDDEVSILQLKFENDFRTLYDMIREDYLIQCFENIVWPNKNDKDNIQDLCCYCCMICYEEYVDDDDVLQIKSCNHSFHQDCMKQWLHHQFRCPICRMQPSPVPHE